MSDRPKIVCLCGSTRFTREMMVEPWESQLRQIEEHVQGKHFQ